MERSVAPIQPLPEKGKPMTELVSYGNYRVHPEAQRIAAESGTTVLAVDRLIRMGYIDPAAAPRFEVDREENP